MPELIYASAKAQAAAQEEAEKPARLARLRQTKSKSLDDICLKFSKKKKNRLDAQVLPQNVLPGVEHCPNKRIKPVVMAAVFELELHVPLFRNNLTHE